MTTDKATVSNPRAASPTEAPITALEDALTAPGDGARTPDEAIPPADRTLLVVGGLCGVASVVSYLAAVISPLHDATHEFPIEASRAAIVFAFWTAALWSPLAIVMLYAIYRLLARERDGAVNLLAFIYGVIGFATVALLATVQLGGQLWVSDLALDAPAAERESWHHIARAIRGVDMGIDLAWDMFLGLWMLLTGLLMLKHSRLGLWWGIPAIVLAVLLLGINAVTVPFPPDTEGLFDPGPFVGLFYAVLSGYLVKLGLAERRVTPGRPAPAGAHPGGAHA